MGSSRKCKDQEDPDSVGCVTKIMQIYEEERA